MMKDQPNIIFITTDQQRFDTIQALGNNKIFTPHLNWMVSEGITFKRCYADCPICVPSRTSLMTGKRGYNTGIVDNMDHSNVMQTHATLPQLLTQHGYQTKAVGKMHFTPVRTNYGFEHMELPLDYMRMHNKNERQARPKAHGCGECELEPVISTVHENDSITKWTVDRTIDFIETRDTTRPFFIWTSFTKPHPPFDPCLNYWMLYRTEDMPEPIYGDWSNNLDQIPKGWMYQTYRFTNMYHYDVKQVQAIRRAYYANITQIDYSLGALFARLSELNLLENTWIVFTSDHGEMLGDHHMAQKNVYYEGAAHIPLIVKPPQGVLQQLRGTSSENLAELVDVTTTLLELAGIDTRNYQMDGTNLLDILQQEEERIFYGNTENNTFCVMQGKIKYLKTRLGGHELLFDLENDPYEQVNLMEVEAYAAIRDELRSLLVTFIQTHIPELIQSGEIVLAPEPQTAQEVGYKWLGFHSSQCEYDVLH